jgi:uncharacterized protein YlzI (FlbEa/FlbD family)
VFPSDNPDTVVEWNAPPVIENVLVIEAYAVPGVVLYLQVADSFVVRESVVDVVPDASVPVGEPLEQVGGVVSGPGSPLSGWG